MFKRVARCAVAAALAAASLGSAPFNYLIHADLAFDASPTAAYFNYARVTGERSARAHLPALMASLQRSGLAGEIAAP